MVVLCCILPHHQPKVCGVWGEEKGRQDRRYVSCVLWSATHKSVRNTETLWESLCWLMHANSPLLRFHCCWLALNQWWSSDLPNVVLLRFPLQLTPVFVLGLPDLCLQFILNFSHCLPVSRPQSSIFPVEQCFDVLCYPWLVVWITLHTLLQLWSQCTNLCSLWLILWAHRYPPTECLAISHLKTALESHKSIHWLFPHRPCGHKLSLD